MTIRLLSDKREYYTSYNNRPAFVNTLLPVTRLHQIYSTTLVIIIVIDNLKYIIIFVYVHFLPWKVLGVYEMYLSVQVSKSLDRLIIPWTIIKFLEEGLSLGDLLSCIKASHFSVIEVSDDLKRAKLLKTFVRNKPDALIVSGSDQCEMAICSQFGLYVKFSVELKK